MSTIDMHHSIPSNPVGFGCFLFNGNFDVFAKMNMEYETKCEKLNTDTFCSGSKAAHITNYYSTSMMLWFAI